MRADISQPLHRRTGWLDDAAATPVLRAIVWPGAALFLAIGVRWLMDGVLHDTLPFVTLFGAVALAQWSGGWRSATGVTIAGYVMAHFLFVSPRGAWSVADVAVMTGAAAFLSTCGFIIAFGELARRSERQLRDSEQALAQRVRCLDLTLTELQEREAVFRTIGEAVPDFLWLADASGRPIYQNPAWARYTGMEPDEFRMHGWETLHPPEDLPALEDAWAQALTHGEPFSIDVRLRRRDGALRWFHCRTVPLRDDTGVVRKWVGTMTDVHDLKRAEEQLGEAAQRKDEFLALLSHELRNPLAPLRSAVDILRLQQPVSASSAGLYDMMERQLAQLVRLVDDLLEISRMSCGTLRLRREPVRVATFIQQAIETTAPSVQRARHTLTTSIDHTGAIVDGDPVRLAQIVTNLLSNAVRYTPDGGRVHIGTHTSATSVVITVTDTGVGIPAAELPHIFEMFTRGRNAFLVREGLGVGLALAAQLADMHGGHIEATSPGPGLGSTFTVHLPCTLESDAIVPATTEPAVSVVAKRILVVDDNADAAESLGQLLRCLGAEVEVARSGASALALLENYDPSLVLLDLGMPEMDGFAVLKALRARDGGSALQVVALTGWGQDRDRERVKAAGFDGHLVKPVDVAALDALLHAAPQHA